MLPRSLVLLACSLCVAVAAAEEPAAAPAPVAAPRPAARVRPKTFAEFREVVTRLTAAGDVDGLWQTCRDLKPAAFPEEPAAGVWLELCRGRAQQGQGQRDAARKSYGEVIRLASMPAGLKGVDNAGAASEARYRLAELAEADYAEYPLCLRQLGIFWGSRQEAEEKVHRLSAAERTYQEAIPGAQRPWPHRAAFRVTAMHVQFYKEAATRTAPGFRGLQGPPPLPGARVTVADEALRLVLDPARSSWPQAVTEVAEAARARAERDGDDADLTAATRSLAEEARNVPPPPRAPVASPFPARGGADRGLRALAVDGEAVVFTPRDGPPRREPVLTAGKQLVEILQGGAAERFAPDAAVALGLGGYRAALPQLRQAVGSADEEVAVAAVFALGELGGELDIPLLLGAYARAQEPGDVPPPYETPSAALFGVRERVLEALAKIGRREPRALQELMRSSLPPRESAFVLWQVSHKDLKWVYQSVAHHPDDVAAAYGVLALISASPQEARQFVSDLKARKGGACWGSHLEQFVGARLKGPVAVPQVRSVP